MSNGFPGRYPKSCGPNTLVFQLIMCVLMASLLWTFGACSDGPSAPKQEDDDPNDWTEWLEANGNALASLTSEEYSDLQVLKPLIGDRRLVQLGESGHGVAEFNQVKVRLIKFLHEEMGFDVIAFESGIYECFQANAGADSLTATQFMSHCPFGVWHTWEVVPLFEYIKSTQETDRPLILAGFDIQPSSWLGNRSRIGFMESVVEAVDPEYAAEVRILEEAFQALHELGESWTVTLAENADTLRAGYEPLLDFFDAHEGDFAAAFESDPVIPLMARQIVWSSLKRIEMASVYGIGTCTGTESRDSGMAANLSFLAQKAYPDKKIVAWAHNFHIRHANRLIQENGGCRTMGQSVAEVHRAELYTVGLYMNQGSAAMNNREVYTIQPAPSGSLEAMLKQAGHPYFFLDFLNLAAEDRPFFIFRSVIARSWGTNTIRLVPIQQYDAVLFIDHVNPPNYTW